MRNVTVTLEEDVALWARVLAAKRNTSVSRLLGDLLKDMMEQEQKYGEAWHEYLSQEPLPLNRGGGPYPARDELHDRNVLR